MVKPEIRSNSLGWYIWDSSRVGYHLLRNLTWSPGWDKNEYCATESEAKDRLAAWRRKEGEIEVTVSIPLPQVVRDQLDEKDREIARLKADFQLHISTEKRYLGEIECLKFKVRDLEDTVRHQHDKIMRIKEALTT